LLARAQFRRRSAGWFAPLESLVVGFRTLAVLAAFVPFVSFVSLVPPTMPGMPLEAVIGFLGPCVRLGDALVRPVLGTRARRGSPAFAVLCVLCGLGAPRSTALVLLMLLALFAPRGGFAAVEPFALPVLRTPPRLRWLVLRAPFAALDRLADGRGLGTGALPGRRRGGRRRAAAREHDVGDVVAHAVRLVQLDLLDLVDRPRLS
jgi:hypothetical protein